MSEKSSNKTSSNKGIYKGKRYAHYSKESRKKHTKYKLDLLEHQARMNKFLGGKNKEINK